MFLHNFWLTATCWANVSCNSFSFYYNEYEYTNIGIKRIDYNKDLKRYNVQLPFIFVNIQKLSQRWLGFLYLAFNMPCPTESLFICLLIASAYVFCWLKIEKSWNIFFSNSILRLLKKGSCQVSGERMRTSTGWALTGLNLPRKTWLIWIMLIGRFNSNPAQQKFGSSLLLNFHLYFVPNSRIMAGSLSVYLLNV